MALSVFAGPQEILKDLTVMVQQSIKKLVSPADGQSENGSAKVCHGSGGIVLLRAE